MHDSGVGRTILARCVVGVALASSITLLASQARDLGEHQKVPEPVAGAVLECQRYLGPQDILGVVYSDVDPEQYLLAYRLAYKLYPAMVAGEPYLTPAEEGSALERALADRPTHLLLLGSPDLLAAPGASLLGRPAPGARLFRLRWAGDR